jgi:hypothetical protein
MISFYTNLSSNDDWQNSPVSIRERGLAGSGDGEDRDSPNLNFHWGSRVSNSLWMGSNGHLNWGSYSSTGIPAYDGTFKTGALTIGSSSTLKAEINNSVSGHQFISQCSDNHNGFEVYQQHGSNTTRNTFAVYANTGSGNAKNLQYAVRGDGLILQPGQPGIYLDALDWTNSNKYMHNGYQFWQTGSNWNNSTGTWTCPVAGKYLVAADAQGHNTHTQSGASGQYANLIPRKNNGNYGLESVATTKEDGSASGGTATHTSFGFSIVMDCAVNDTIRVYSNHGFRTNTQNHLTIYLLG